MAGVEESMQKDGDLTTADLQARINLKREARYQDEIKIADTLDDLEPLPEEPGEVVSDEPAPPEEEEGAEPEGEPGEGVEEEPEEGPGEPEEVVEDDFYVGRYKTREVAEDALAEKDRTIDRLFQELAERDQRQPQQPEGPAQLDVPAWHQWADQAVAEGQGISGAMEALRTGGPEGYDIYLAHWLSDPEQVPQAQAFNNQVQRQFAANQAMQAMAPLVQREQERMIEDEAEVAKMIVADGKDDFDDLQDEMDRLVREDGLLPVETKQRLAAMAQQGGVEGKVHAWEYLYMAAQAAKGKTRAKAQRVEDGRRRAKADRAKIAATVSTSEGAATRTPLSEAESYVVKRKNAIREKLGQPLIEE